MGKSLQKAKVKPKRNPAKLQRSGIIREFSAGGVVYRETKNGSLWLLINPAGSDRWQLPKGHIDGREHSDEAAMREVFEETAVKAKAVKKIGTSQYFFVLKGKRILKTVAFFLMQYLSGGKKEPDIEIEKAQFFPYDKAVKKLTFKDDKDVLSKAKKALGQGIQENLI